jgi:hemoglobin
MRARATLTAILVVAAAGMTAAGADEPTQGEKLQADRKAARAAHKAAADGTILYNTGDHDGCYRVYRDTLVALGPTLAHRPKLAARVKEHLERAATMRPTKGAFVLREALDLVVDVTAPSLARSLWERLGGEKAVREIVRESSAAAVADPKLNATRDGQFKFDEKTAAHMEQMLVEFISEKSGGPLRYTGKDLKGVHKDMKITDDEFDAMTGHLAATLTKRKVPRKEMDELIAIITATRRDVVEEKK